MNAFRALAALVALAFVQAAAPAMGADPQATIARVKG